MNSQRYIQQYFSFRKKLLVAWYLFLSVVIRKWRSTSDHPPPFVPLRPVSQIFGCVSRPQTLKDPREGHAHYPTKTGQNIKIGIDKKLPNCPSAPLNFSQILSFAQKIMPRYGNLHQSANKFWNLLSPKGPGASKLNQNVGPLRWPFQAIAFSKTSFQKYFRL